MSSNRTLTVCLQMALAVVLVGPMLAAPVTAVPYVSQAQAQQLEADYGAGAPFGQWQKLREVQTFYLHSNADAGTNSPYTPNDAGLDIWYDTHLPPLVTPGGNNREEVRLGLGTAVTATGNTQYPYLWIPGGPDFGDQGCLGPPGSAAAGPQAPPVLDDTSIFRIKVRFWGTMSGLEENHLRVEFVDIDQNTNPPINPTETCAWDYGAGSEPSRRSCNASSIGRCVFAVVRADPSQTVPPATYGCNPVIATCGSSANSYLFESDWIDVCAPLGGNQITPACSPLYGYNLRRGHSIGLRIHADTDSPVLCGPYTPPQPCGNDAGNIILNFDTRSTGGNCGLGNLYCGQMGYPSHFLIEADSARINMWAEDRFRAVTNNFPPGRMGGVETSTLDRTVRWKGVQVSTWGHECGTIGDTSAVDRANDCMGPGDVPPFPKVWDGIEEYDTFLRIRDMNPSHTGNGYCRFQGDFCYNQFLSMDLTLGLQGGDPGQDELKIQCCNLPTANRPIMKEDPACRRPNPPLPAPSCDPLLGIQRYRYDLVYPPSFKDGEYRFEFQDEGHGWNALYTFYVGGAGFDFKFHTDEPRVDSTRTIADHLVALNEPTKYSMVLTNNGVTTDTYALAVPTPGQGWAATVSPNSVTLPPKATADIDITVIPPTSARAGDIKVVSVTAASPATNQVLTLFTRTTYTALRTFDVDVLAARDLVELRPGLAKVIPVSVVNNGTVADSFVLTTKGAPAGWTVSLNPAFLPVMAASREDVILTVRADPGANPGTSFTLTVMACKTDDDTVCGDVEIPVRVFEVHGVEVETLPEMLLQCRTLRTRVLDATAPVETPLNETLVPCSQITLRDAERDYRTQDQSRGTCAAGFGGVGSGAGSGQGGTGFRGCFQVANRDTKFDDSAVFRVKITNTGDTQDHIELTGAWDPPAYHTGNAPVWDREDCDGTDDVETGGPTFDGVPDGWRFRILGGGRDPATTAPLNPWDLTGSGQSAGIPVADPGMIYPTPTQPVPARITFHPDAAVQDWHDVDDPQRGTGARFDFNGGANTAFAGDYRIGFITLPPRTSQYVYVELLWTSPLNGLNSFGNAHPDECIPQFRYSDPSVPVVSNVNTASNFRNHMPSPNAFFRLAWRSSEDASYRGETLLHAHLADGDPSVASDPGDSRTATVNADGDDPRDPATNLPLHARYRVLLERGIGQPDEEYAPLGTPAPYATFNMVATNLGNEYDNLKIDVDNGRNGWRHAIQSMPVGTAGTGILPSGLSWTDPTPPNMPTCTPPNGLTPCVDRVDRGMGATSPGGCAFTDPPANQHMICRSMGVGDAVNFQVRCTPPPWARPGDQNDMTITVTSDRANLLSGLNTFSRMTVRCIAQGQYSFALENLNRDLLGYRTQTIAFPFTIHNDGLNNDRYFVALDSHTLPDGKVADLATDPWNPQTSSGAIVAVPAGHRYHGFLSVTIPADADITAEGPVLPGAVIRAEDDPLRDHNFRLKVQSLDSPGTESKTLDFTAIVTETPAFTVHAEPVTIASGMSDRIRIKAVDCEPGAIGSACSGSGLTSVEFDGYYINANLRQPLLPRGFDFTCLRGDTDGDGYSDHQEIVANEPPPTGENFNNPTAWMNANARPSAPIQPFTPHPNFDKYRGCYLRPETIPQVALPNPANAAQSCYPSAPQTPNNRPPCGAYEYHVTPTFSPSREAIQQLEIQVPEKQLGVSRVAHRIEANAVKSGNCGATDMRCRFVSYTDAIINMKSVYGVELNVTEDPGDCGRGCKVIPPGRNALGVGPTGIPFNIAVVNSGLTPQSVLLTHSALPPGWEPYWGAAKVPVQPPGYLLPEADPTITEDADPRTACANAQPCLLVDPQDRVFIEFGLIAPPNAQPGARATVILFGTVQEDTTKVAQLQLTAQVGQYGVEVSMSPSTYFVQPDEPARFVVTVTNTGTVKANFDLAATLPAASSLPEEQMPPCPNPLTGQSAAAKLSYCFVTQPECRHDPAIQTVADPKAYACYLDALDVGESRQVVLEVKIPPGIAPTKGSDPGYLVSVSARNALSPARGVADATVKVLNYVQADVDGDGAMEYAIDACTVAQGDGCLPDAGDGFETFREAACRCGVVSREAPLAQYLDEKSRARVVSENLLRGESYVLDANGDRRQDHLIDTDGDTLPDVLWIPDKAGDVNQRVVTRINYTRDVTGDQLPELFLDADVDGRWDLIFDLAKGRFIGLFQVFADGDDVLDYIVDANGNGERDEGETVLLGGARGSITGTIFHRDVDGDGTVDSVYDLDGDVGVPEYFIDGKCDSRVKACGSFEITARDVTGDGRLDWTYDHTGKNGRPNAYYDPHCDPADGVKCSDLIDTKAQFLRDLGKYWFIGALFVLALVLFGALLWVTRRR